MANPNQQHICDACAVKRLHTEDDWRNHPFAGHGYTKEHGWTHADIALKPEAH